MTFTTMTVLLLRDEG